MELLNQLRSVLNTIEVVIPDLNLAGIVLDYLPKNLWDYQHVSVHSLNTTAFSSFQEFIEKSASWGSPLYFCCDNPFLDWHESDSDDECIGTMMNVNFANCGAYVPLDRDNVARVTQYIRRNCLNFAFRLDILFDEPTTRKRKQSEIV